MRGCQHYVAGEKAMATARTYAAAVPAALTAADRDRALTLAALWLDVTAAEALLASAAAALEGRHGDPAVHCPQEETR